MSKQHMLIFSFCHNYKGRKYSIIILPSPVLGSIWYLIFLSTRTNIPWYSEHHNAEYFPYFESRKQKKKSYSCLKNWSSKSADFADWLSTLLILQSDVFKSHIPIFPQKYRPVGFFLHCKNVFFSLTVIDLLFTPLLLILLIRQTNSVWLLHLLLCSVFACGQHWCFYAHAGCFLILSCPKHHGNDKYSGAKILVACCSSMQGTYSTKIFEYYF